MQPKSSRAWTTFSITGIVLWVGAMVLAGVLNDDPSDPAPTLWAFVIGGSIFFGLMFAGVLWTWLRRRADDPASRFTKAIAIGYTLAGVATTGLGIAAVAQQGLLGGGDVRIFVVPMVAIIVVWAVAAVLVLRRFARASR